MYDLIVQGGTVVMNQAKSQADLLIKGGVIVGIVQDASGISSHRRIQAEGCYVLPGGVDPHVHTNLPLGEFSTLDTFEECTTAAALGGNTTIVDFSIPQSGQTPLEAFNLRIHEAKTQLKVDLNLHAGLTRINTETLTDIPKLAELGAKTFKMFTVYRDLVMLSLDEIWHALHAIAQVGGLAVVHAESNHIIEGNIASYVKQGLTTPKYHPSSRPTVAEVDAVQSVINMLHETGGAGYFVHVSTPEALSRVVEAQGKGIKVWAETCPHYLVLNDELYQTEHGERFICSPPLRSTEQAEELWIQTTKGNIAIIGSDHCCYDTSQKAQYREDFTKAPNGLPGVQTRLPVMFSEGVMKGRISIEQFAALTATNPAKLNGLYPKKGTLQIGSDADITIYDPNVSRTLSARDLQMKTDYTPFEGVKLLGEIRHVIARGDVIVEDGTFIGSNHVGTFVPSATPSFEM